MMSRLSSIRVNMAAGDDQRALDLVYAAHQANRLSRRLRSLHCPADVDDAVGF
jgi:hypothetical protein